MRHLWILLPLFLIIHGSKAEDVFNNQPATPYPEDPHSPAIVDYDQNSVDWSDFTRKEGDIMVRRSPGSSSYGQSGLIDKSKRWSNAEVPYKCGRDLVNNTFKATILREAMEEISRRTCVKFVQNIDNRPDYVLFKTANDNQCSTEIGRQGGLQNVTLADNCFTRGIIQHQLMHILGFHHEHNRPDRDQWIEIQRRNIKEPEYGRPKDQYMQYFEKRTDEERELLETGYSYETIMHIDQYAFSKDKKNLPTIVAKRPGGEKIGNRDYLADIDVLRINAIYGCEDKLKATARPETVREEQSTLLPPSEKTRPVSRLPPPTSVTSHPSNNSEIAKTAWREIYSCGAGDYNLDDITVVINRDSSITVKAEKNGILRKKWLTVTFTTPDVYSEVKKDLRGGRFRVLAPEHEVTGKLGEIFYFDLSRQRFEMN